MKVWSLFLAATVALAITACDNKKKNNTVAVPPSQQCVYDQATGQYKYNNTGQLCTPPTNAQCVYDQATGQYKSTVTGQICQPNQSWYQNNWNQFGWNHNYAPVQPLPYQYYSSWGWSQMSCPWGTYQVYDYYTYSWYCVYPQFYNSGGFNAWLGLWINL
jgi:hypothetical protein